MSELASPLGQLAADMDTTCEIARKVDHAHKWIRSKSLRLY